MRWFTDKWTKDNIVLWHKRQANLSTYNGIVTPRSKLYTDSCISGYRPDGTIILFTRDCEMHDCGWWKNPDYNQCLHLSLSYRDPKTGLFRGKHQSLTDEWLELFYELFYGPLQRLMWTEPPYYPEGKRADVWHYRVFYDRTWSAPLLPRGEVYSKKWTPAHWLSYSDLQEKLGRKRPDVDGSGVPQSQ